MSAFSDGVDRKVQEIVATTWARREGRVVPKTEDVALRDGAVTLKATYLYADLGDSSGAAQKLLPEVTAKIIRSYLDAASRIIRHFDGEIRSFDGDRVMGIFIGDRKNTNAAKAALGINWAVHKVLRPAFLARWPRLGENYRLHHGVGIATGASLIVRGGVRNNSDLVSVGPAANVAAKLSDLRGSPATYVTRSVYNQLARDAKYSTDNKLMWSTFRYQTIGGKVYEVVGSTWWVRP